MILWKARIVGNIVKKRIREIALIFFIVLNRDGNFAPPRFGPRGFSSPCKGGGAGMGRDFSPASWGGAGMGLDFLDLTHPTLH